MLARLTRQLAPAKERLQWIKAALGSNLRLIPVAEVLFFQSDEKYTRVVTAEGPVRVLIGLAGAVIGFVAVAAALALTLAIFYVVGYILLAVIIIVLVAVVIGLSPVLAPFALLALFIWWMDRRKRNPKRVEPTLQAAAEPAPAASTEPGR